MRMAAMPSAEGTKGCSTPGTMVAKATVMPAPQYHLMTNSRLLCQYTHAKQGHMTRVNESNCSVSVVQYERLLRHIHSKHAPQTVGIECTFVISQPLCICQMRAWHGKRRKGKQLMQIKRIHAGVCILPALDMAYL